MYILLTNNIVTAIIPNENPVFPGIPIDKRYSAEFLAECIALDDATGIRTGMLYDADTQTFSEPAPLEPEPATAPDLDTLRAAKLDELSDACNAAIVAGCDVTLADGTVEHFALEETDQINLNAAYTACQQGATEYPYHADGQLCRLYSAADIIAIGDAATAHKLYHTTYCNHLLTWARRAETADELAGIVYGVELPEDLKANMVKVLGGAT